MSVDNSNEAKTKVETIQFKLNGNPVSVPKGWTVMQAAKKFGVSIPHFCWHPGLSVAGVCRFCMVRVQGRPKMEIACNLQATEGMEVFTDTEEVKETHKWALEFHLINHPLDCPICDQAGECGLQDYYMKVGKYHSQMTRPKVLKPKALDVGGDLVLDTERCILCSRCVRFEEEVTKTDALGIFDRGDRAIIGTYPGKKLNHEYTANLVDICPVGAFTSKDFRFKQRVWFLEDAPSVCPGCSTGCHVDVYAKEQNRKYFRLKPRESEVNKHWMCDPGRKMYEHLNRENRVLGPALGNQSNLKDHSQIFHKLKQRLAEVSSSDVSVLISAQYNNEEYDSLFRFLIQEKGIKNIYLWREDNEDVKKFDGILRRGDHNSNTAGLLKSLENFGIKKATVKNELDELISKSPSLVLAFSPEVPRTFPSLYSQLEKLSKLKEVHMFGLPAVLSQFTWTSLLSAKAFTEKEGHSINASGSTYKRNAIFPSAIDSAIDLQEWVDLAKLNQQEQKRA